MSRVSSAPWILPVAVALASLTACGDGDTPFEPPERSAERPAPADAPIDLGTLGGELTMALDIANDRTVVGWSHDAEDRRRPFVWTSREGMRDLGTLGGEEGVALAVNEQGTVVGWSHDAEGRMLATIWPAGGGATAGAATALPALEVLGASPADAAPSAATAINRGGVVVGWAGGDITARWTRDGRAETICGPRGFPSDIDDRGRVVGVASTVVGAFLVQPDGTSREYSGFLWTPGDDGCRGLIDDEFAAYEVAGINNRGTIVGLGAEWEDFDPPEPGLILVTRAEIPFLFDERTGFRRDAGLPDTPEDLNARGTVVGDGFMAINDRGDRVGGNLLYPAGSTAALARGIRTAIPGGGIGSDCPGLPGRLVEMGALSGCPLDR